MRTLILALGVLFVWLVGAACSAQETTTHSNMDTQFFERNSSKLEELALLFLSDRLDHPNLSHIDFEGVGPRSLQLSKSRLDRYRALMEGLGVSLIAKGDFSGNNLNSTVYLVTERRNLEEHFVQEGYLFGVNLAEGESKTTRLYLHRLEDDWFYFVRKEEHELY